MPSFVDRVYEQHSLGPPGPSRRGCLLWPGRLTLSVLATHPKGTLGVLILRWPTVSGGGRGRGHGGSGLGAATRAAVNTDPRWAWVGGCAHAQQRRRDFHRKVYSYL